jgi:hypothetical protein
MGGDNYTIRINLTITEVVFSEILLRKCGKAKTISNGSNKLAMKPIIN